MNVGARGGPGGWGWLIVRPLNGCVGTLLLPIPNIEFPPSLMLPKFCGRRRLASLLLDVLGLVVIAVCSTTPGNTLDPGDDQTLKGVYFPGNGSPYP